MKRLIIGAGFALFVSPALACSCIPVTAATPKPEILLSAEVRAVASVNDGRESVATLRVATRFIGQTPKTIRVTTRTSSAACGVSFAKGKRQLFALQRAGNSYTTDLCLMQQARL